MCGESQRYLFLRARDAPLLNVLCELGDQRVHFDRALRLLAPAPMSRSHRPIGLLPITHDEHQGDLLGFGFANLVPELFVARVEVDPDSRALERRFDGSSVRQMPLRDG